MDPSWVIGLITCRFSFSHDRLRMEWANGPLALQGERSAQTEPWMETWLGLAASLWRSVQTPG